MLFKLKRGLPGQAIHRDGFINCYLDVKKKLVYLHVDKCGSTSITSAFISEGMTFIPLENFRRAKDYETMAEFLFESGYTFDITVSGVKNMSVSFYYKVRAMVCSYIN